MKKLKRIFKRKAKAKVQKLLSFKLALILILQCAWPSASMALTGGPSQPEVQSFEPIGTFDMVDLFSGDFSYNIPLFDLDGYPMNISYHSGIGMDQEASWVGLGWNINPGVINRNMRGLPDDFNGDEVVKEQNIKKNQTVGISCGFTGEWFGSEEGVSLSARLGIKYNNYTGVGIEQSFNVALSRSNSFGGSGCASLGITSSSDDGLSLTPSISLSQTLGKSDRSTKVGMSIGASFSSRGGLSALTVKPDITQNIGPKNKANRYVHSSLPTGAAKFDFGQQTYSPNLDFPMENLSVTANFKFGFEAEGFAGSIAPGGYYSEQGQLVKSITSPAFGYMNAQNGQQNPAAMMDFNREKDGSFNKSTYNLPITNLTYDLYSVSGQGTGGSYRPFRSDVGHVFDIASYSTSDGYSGSVEIGAGSIFKGGVDIVVNGAYSQSGDWTSSKAYDNLLFQGSGPNPDYEPYYFKEANERSVNSDPAFISRYGGYTATRFELNGDVKFDTKATGKLKTLSGSLMDVSPADQRKQRDKRNQTITTLTNREVYEGMGLFGGSTGSGVKNTYVSANITKLGHHIGQITSLNTDGKRYVYALPAYNKEQQEVTFAVGKPAGGGNARPVSNGMVIYNPGQDNTFKNKMGLDNYYSNTIMPPFAHSYLLSAVLSSDYVDLTGDGPSDDDLGNYVLFDYALKTPDYNWRTPTKTNEAKFSQGLVADVNDDKGNYVCGVKQLYYLDKITTKNYQAQFFLSARPDGKGVNDENGGTSSGANQFELDKIVLKSRAGNKVVKTVHFVYKSPSTSLCQNTQNSNNNEGKLTLEKLYFTYQNSDKGSYNSYDFTYSNINPGYSSLNYDRWGNYKSANPTSALPLDFYPYTNQDPANSAIDPNKDAKAWLLSEIKLPSGGKISVDYEADDYAYVQDKKAAQMYLYDNGLAAPTNYSLTNTFDFSFRIPAGAPSNVKIEDFLPDNRMVFFKFKMYINGSQADYVPGYAEADLANSSISGSYGKIRFVQQTINDNPTPSFNNPLVCPITKAALQFGRLNVPRVVWDQPNASASLGQQVIKALINSNLFSSVQQAVMGPNWYLYYKQRCALADLSRSWIKLKNVTGHKYGGGSRVKSILMNDDFSTMTNNAESPSDYGQLYTYTTLDEKRNTISSGVASYEPQIGGEENALKEPFFTETKKLLAPDDEHYTEAPFGESFFPSASVGYSKVKVENYYPDPSTFPAPYTNITTARNHGTGYIINEFYTAKDFPTLTERTELEAIEHKTSPFSIQSLLSIDTKNHMTTSQGFYVELNDMHGKPKATKVYNASDYQISSVEYFYKSKAYGKSGSKRLINTVTTINPNGATSSGEVGVFFDMVGDLREQSTESETDGINVNTDIIFITVPVITIVPIPSYSSDKTQFRSAVITKVVQRFGILEKTVSKTDGSTVTSSDLAYDSETGEVLLTQTTNGFNDPEYAFKYPAYWYYKNMAAAYSNIDYTQTISLTSGGANLNPGTNLFAEGDELELQTIPVNSSSGPSYSKAWVIKSLKNSLVIKDIAGNNPADGVYIAKVIRSGKRNMQTMEMANVLTMVNPLGGVRSNVFQRVISSKAIEYSNAWNVNCNCATPGLTPNPYTIGLLGNWKMLRSYEYLSPRSQTNANDNSNIRVDGMYTAFSPFYKNTGGKWRINSSGWTFTSEVSEMSVGGQELENKDALGRFSAATYGYNQSLATAVASNSRYRELAYQGFEDNPQNCNPDKHFILTDHATSNTFPPGITTNESHTGNKSVAVNYTPGSNTYEGRFGVYQKISTDCSKPDPCPGSITFNSLPSALRFEIVDAQPPFSIEVEKISGDGTIKVGTDGASFKVLPVNSTYKANVIIVDQKGCVYTKSLFFPYTN